jgi:hypothetical protein
MAFTTVTDERKTHGGLNDNENITQKNIAHSTSLIRKTVAQSRPPVTPVETIIATLHPKQ